MNIHLKNIGLIKESNIQLDGLTVITGKNSSGKTTVGKALYSIIEATINVERKAENDKKHYIRNTVEKVEKELDIFRFLKLNHVVDIGDFFAEESILNRLLDMDRMEIPCENEEFVLALYNELKSFDVQKLITDNILDKRFARLITRNGDVKVAADILEARINKSIDILDNLFNRLESDPNLIDYTRERIGKTLNVEFSDQIQPLKGNGETSYIEVYDDIRYYNIFIENNTVVNNQEPVFISSPFNKVFFIDDPFVLDKPRVSLLRRMRNENTGTFLDEKRIVTHDVALSRILRQKMNYSVYEEMVLKEQIADISNQLDETLLGSFEFGPDGEFYIQDGKKLKVSNLATGSKMISIIKILLDKGLLDGNTLLILDEPEAHLHPSWQNLFAEIIVMLVKKLHIHILLTTHSSNFMLAIDAYMRKHSINDKCNFYQTTYLEDGFVTYKNVNDDMGQIYADFMEYLSQVKMLRDEYL